MSWQLGLVENEVDSLLRGYELRQARRLVVPVAKLDNDSPSNGSQMTQRPIQKEDICPVCQDEFFTKTRKPVTYCR